MTHARTRVVKVGGSLFDMQSLGSRLRQWLDRHQDQRNVLIAGGGPLVDCIRQWDDHYGLGDGFAHRESITLMSSTARVLGQLLPNAPIVTSIGDLHDDRDQILDVTEFVLTRSDLPESWTVTSDAIAATVALELGADLHLFKSTLPQSDDMGDWSHRGFVDEHFVELANTLRKVTVSNLRSNDSVTVTGHCKTESGSLRSFTDLRPD